MGKYNEKPMLLLAAALTLSSCTSHQKLDVEKKLIYEMSLHKDDDVNRVDINNVFGDGWRKICIQGPYQTQEGFESAIGEKVNFYPAIKDNSNAFVILYKSGEIGYVEIVEVNAMPRARRGTICTSSAYPYLNFNKVNGKKSYYFDDSKES